MRVTEHTADLECEELELVDAIGEDKAEQARETHEDVLDRYLPDAPIIPVQRLKPAPRPKWSTEGLDNARARRGLLELAKLLGRADAASSRALAAAATVVEWAHGGARTDPSTCILQVTAAHEELATLGHRLEQLALEYRPEPLHRHHRESPWRAFVSEARAQVNDMRRRARALQTLCEGIGA